MVVIYTMGCIKSNGERKIEQDEEYLIVVFDEVVADAVAG
jgi:hypothetical protein